MAELLKALTDVQTYLKTQQALLQNAGAFEACLKQQVDSWEQKFRSAKIDAVEAADLISALANGPWQTDQKARLSSSINDALIECSGTKGQRRPSQQVTNFGAYLMQMDLDALKSQASMIAKCEALAARSVLQARTAFAIRADSEAHHCNCNALWYAGAQCHRQLRCSQRAQEAVAVEEEDCATTSAFPRELARQT